MIMNKYLLFGVLSSMLLVGTACEDFKFGNDFLDKPITTDITIDTVFNHKKYADQILAQAYHSLPDFLPKSGRFAWSMLDCLTDIGDCVGSGGADRTYYAGQVTAATEVGLMPYRLTDDALQIDSPTSGIRICYIYLENVDRVPDMTEAEKMIRKAEVKVIIAYHYMDMLRYYGGMPWVDKSYKPSDELKFTRMTVEEHVNKIVELCDEAAGILPWSVSAEEEGHMTAVAALGLKNRVLQFAASPLFNSEQPFLEGEASELHYTWYGNKDNTRWQRALDSGLEFLEANQQNGDYYKLVNTGNPREDYLAGYFNRCNREVLLPTHRYTTINHQWFYSLYVLAWGWTCPTAVYADMFEMKDGTPFDWNNPEHAAHPFFDENGEMVRDPRMYETLIVNGDKFRGRTAEIYQGGRETWEGTSTTLGALTYNGYGMRKFILDQDTELFGKFYQCPHIRIAEIYLDIAEAMNELGKANEKDRFGRDAYDYVNLVRNRVGMPDLDREKYPAGEDLRNAILHERAVEFGYEEVRYFDIIRWKRVDLLRTEQYRLKATRNADGSMTYRKDADMKYPNRMWVERWTDRFYLLPIPVSEINKKYGLIQNPGWE